MGPAARAQRNLFHKMGWLDAPLFRMVASLRYANSAGAPSNPGPDHWRKVLVRSAALDTHTNVCK